jgi:hypothetical protein
MKLLLERHANNHIKMAIRPIEASLGAASGFCVIWQLQSNISTNSDLEQENVKVGAWVALAFDVGGFLWGFATCVRAGK